MYAADINTVISFVRDRFDLFVLGQAFFIFVNTNTNTSLIARMWASMTQLQWLTVLHSE